MIINARFATIDDFDWCAELDNHIPNETILRRKIAAEEILLAEANGQRVGYCGWNICGRWSRILPSSASGMIIASGASGGRCWPIWKRTCANGAITS